MLALLLVASVLRFVFVLELISTFVFAFTFELTGLTFVLVELIFILGLADLKLGSVAGLVIVFVFGLFAVSMTGVVCAKAVAPLQIKSIENMVFFILIV